MLAHLTIQGAEARLVAQPHHAKALAWVVRHWNAQHPEGPQMVLEIERARSSQAAYQRVQAPADRPPYRPEVLTHLVQPLEWKEPPRNVHEALGRALEHYGRRALRRAQEAAGHPGQLVPISLDRTVHVPAFVLKAFLDGEDE